MEDAPMSALTTFHVSRLLGLRVISPGNEPVGIIRDLLINNAPDNQEPDEPFRPRIVAVKIGSKTNPVYLDFTYFEIRRDNGKYSIICSNQQKLTSETVSGFLPPGHMLLPLMLVWKDCFVA